MRHALGRGVLFGLNGNDHFLWRLLEFQFDSQFKVYCAIELDAGGIAGAPNNPSSCRDLGPQGQVDCGTFRDVAFEKV